MCLGVEANGSNGSKDAISIGNAKGTHVSVFIHVMRGDNDDNLKWLFRGTIKVSLLNQLEDGQHHTALLSSPNAWVPCTCARVTVGERAVHGMRKCNTFIGHQELNFRSDKNCQYLKDNTLFFRVDCIEPKLD